MKTFDEGILEGNVKKLQEEVKSLQARINELEEENKQMEGMWVNLTPFIEGVFDKDEFVRRVLYSAGNIQKGMLSDFPPQI